MTTRRSFLAALAAVGIVPASRLLDLPAAESIPAPPPVLFPGHSARPHGAPIGYYAKINDRPAMPLWDKERHASQYAVGDSPSVIGFRCRRIVLTVSHNPLNDYLIYADDPVHVVVTTPGAESYEFDGYVTGKATTMADHIPGVRDEIEITLTGPITTFVNE